MVTGFAGEAPREGQSRISVVLRDVSNEDRSAELATKIRKLIEALGVPGEPEEGTILLSAQAVRNIEKATKLVYENHYAKTLGEDTLPADFFGDNEE